MKIKQIHLEKFKRFTDLTIEDIPETAKLVVLVGLFFASTFWKKLQKEMEKVASPKWRILQMSRAGVFQPGICKHSSMFTSYMKVDLLLNNLSSLPDCRNISSWLTSRKA